MNNENEVNIAYQNKDITSKIMAEGFKNKSFAVYGIDVPKIVDVRPTNLPAVETTELRIDDLFYLADDSVAIVDYESKYSEANKVKYIEYLARVIKRIYNDEKHFRKLRLIIIYTADVERGTTTPQLDLGCTELTLTEAFLNDIKSEAVRKQLFKKLENDEPLNDEDLMRLIVYPLTYIGKKAQQEAVTEAIDLAERISDEGKEKFVLSMMLSFADKIISREDTERIVRRIKMRSKVLQYFEDEKEAAVRDAVENDKRNMVIGLLREGDPFDKISRITGLNEDKIKAIESSMLQNA